MFHWICPECGREIAPTVRECPVCDPAAATVENALAGEVEAPARALDPAPHAAEIAVEPVSISPASATRRSGLGPPAAARWQRQRHPQLAARVEARFTARQRRIPSVSQTRNRSTHCRNSARPTGDAIRWIIFPRCSIRWSRSRRLRARRCRCRWGRCPRVPASLRAFIAELRPAGTKANAPLTPLQRVRAAFEPPLLTTPTRCRSSPMRRALRAPLGAKLLALPATPSHAVPADTHWIWRRRWRRLGNYSPLAGRPLQPSLPETQVLKRECAPRTTLPGPMLTRRLVKFGDRELSAIPPGLLRLKKRLIPGWMASALIIGTLLGRGLPA